MSQLSTFYSPLTAADLGLGNSANVTFGSVTTGAVTGSGNATFGSIQNTPIGNTTPNSGAFTTLTASTSITGPLGSSVGTVTAPVIAFGTSGTGFYMSGGQPLFAHGGGAVWYRDNSNRVVFSNGAIGGIVIETTDAPLNFSRSITLIPDGATGVLAQRNFANPQTFNIYNTFTNASNYERGFLRWSSNVLQIGTEAGGTGSARALELQTNGTTRLTIGATTGSVVCSGALSVVTNLTFQGNSSIVGNIASGVLRLVNNTATDFDRLQFGGGTSSFPALKRSSTTLQVRLANDTDFTAIQGKLTTETAYTAGAPTATGYLVLYDSNGTAYKVPAEAL